MRKTITTAALSLAIACGSLALTGTANAAVDTGTNPAACLSYQYVNGVWKLVQTGCTSSSTGTSGSSGGSSSGGTGTQGTATNNCNTGCTATANGTPGKKKN